MISSIMALLQGSRQWVDVMKSKRAVHEEVINLVLQQRSAKHVEEVYFHLLCIIWVLFLMLNVHKLFVGLLITEARASLCKSA